jgi:hypothetical protein
MKQVSKTVLLAVTLVLCGAGAAYAGDFGKAVLTVPEPSTLGVMAIGLAAWGFLNRRRSR